MSDVTRPAGDAPDERDRQTPDARGETALGTSRAGGVEPVPGARADHTTGTRAETAPGLRGDAATPADTAHGGAIVPHEEYDKLGQRLQHAVAGFVDGPRAAVEEADHVLEEVTARLTDAVTQRRRTLRRSWQDAGDTTSSTDTEQLRLALRDYRELADRLMRL
ncbi:hypothetical protein GCM10010377_27500 [Streptomyces viridiviolaceus]|uniref:Uncharacterized protein n=1 Tax=Streptomyces viridiviolaceus TaxID=68282 RepID=A0ABW2DSA4_9ACTN|nr:hypothetical protein [Streptomyces viridiviolaceus]GHB34872.1 hypothetical protein GCM10010377_27500 [Streptomyces viridiviolaceus]